MPILLFFLFCVGGVWWLDLHGGHWFCEILTWAGGIGFAFIVCRDILRLVWFILRIPVLIAYRLISWPVRMAFAAQPALPPHSDSVRQTSRSIPELCPPEHPEWN